MTEKLMRRKAVELMTGLGRSSLYAKMAEGTFPASIKIGSQAVAWRECEVQAWISGRIAESRGEKAN